MKGPKFKRPRGKPLSRSSQALSKFLASRKSLPTFAHFGRVHVPHITPAGEHHLGSAESLPKVHPRLNSLKELIGGRTTALRYNFGYVPPCSKISQPLVKDGSKV